MQNEVVVRLGSGDRERLQAVVADRNSAQKHVWRARIILAIAEGRGTAEVMRRAGVSKPCVWRWQRRFIEAGVDGLLRVKTRKPGKAPFSDPVVAQLIARTLGDPPGETTHWTSRVMAEVMGLAVSTVLNHLEEAGDRLFTFTRLPRCQWKSARTTNAIERLHEELKRRIKTQTVLPSAETAAMLFWGCSRPVRSPCAKSTDGRLSPKSSLTSQLTLLPDPVSLPYLRPHQSNSNTNRDGTSLEVLPNFTLEGRRLLSGSALVGFRAT